MHSYDGNNNLTAFSLDTFLINVNIVIITGHDKFSSYVSYAGDPTVYRRRLLNAGHNVTDVVNDDAVERDIPGASSLRRKLIRVEFNGNPGKRGITRDSIYIGTHRTMIGMLIANDTFPDADFYYVFDDDNYMPVEYVCYQLNHKTNPKVPLLLSGAVGPKAGGHAPCNEVNTPDHWSCCTSLMEPCRAYTDGVKEQSAFQWSDEKETFVPVPCTSHEAQSDSHLRCHQSVPWPEGMQYGFPYRVRRPDTLIDAVPHHALYAPHKFPMFPYGGATYVLTKPLMNAIGRDRWEFWTYGTQFENADIDIMLLVFNAGYSITSFPTISVIHHVKNMESFISVGSHHYTDQCDEAVKRLCSYDYTNASARFCILRCPECPQFQGTGASASTHHVVRKQRQQHENQRPHGHHHQHQHRSTLLRGAR